MNVEQMEKLRKIQSLAHNGRINDLLSEISEKCSFVVLENTKYEHNKVYIIGAGENVLIRLFGAHDTMLSPQINRYADKVLVEKSFDQLVADKLKGKKGGDSYEIVQNAEFYNVENVSRYVKYFERLLNILKLYDVH